MEFHNTGSTPNLDLLPVYVASLKKMSRIPSVQRLCLVVIGIDLRQN